MSSLITGAGGFVGQWLIRALLERHEAVTGFTLETPADIGVLSRQHRSAVTWVVGDIRDPIRIDAALEAAMPDVVYHLAGVTYIPAAGSDPTTTYDVNTLGVARLMAAVASVRNHSDTTTRVLVVGSGEQYGSHDDSEYPLPETAAQTPMTVYAASKAAQEIVALQATREYGIDVVATRSFNHSGPGQDTRFLLPALVQRVKALVGAQETRFPIGDTTPVRDFLHVHDVVRAYIALAEFGTPGEVYNVSSGTGRSVGEIIELVLKIAEVRATPWRDESLVRRVDVQRSIGDNSKLMNATGWKPEHTLDDMVRDTWEAFHPLR